MQAEIEKTYATLSYANSLHQHRDTHVHLNLLFSGNRFAHASVSKTMHGATNDFEITVLGTKGSVTWCFLKPDEIILGRGSKATIVRRNQMNSATLSQPFHGFGWLEGYAEIILQSLKAVVGLEASSVPSLKESLQGMKCILNANSLTGML